MRLPWQTKPPSDKKDARHFFSAIAADDALNARKQDAENSSSTAYDLEQKAKDARNIANLKDKYAGVFAFFDELQKASDGTISVSIDFEKSYDESLKTWAIAAKIHVKRAGETRREYILQEGDLHYDTPPVDPHGRGLANPRLQITDHAEFRFFQTGHMQILRYNDTQLKHTHWKKAVETDFNQSDILTQLGVFIESLGLEQTLHARLQQKFNLPKVGQYRTLEHA